LLHEIAGYGAVLESFIDEESLPPEWFDYPDYLAIKTANGNHFEQLVERFKASELAEVKRITCTVVDERRFATAFLGGALMVGQSWGVELINIAEPRPENADQGYVGVDHMGFYWRSSLMEISNRLQTVNGIVPDFQPSSGHTSLSLTISSRQADRYLKFSTKPLASIVKEELSTGEASVIYDRTAG
jgi:hypothetical protein